MSKLPAFQFYPSDWRSDPGVQSLDYFDRGVWFEILCLMHESSERGKLLLNGKPMPTEALARILGLDKQKLSSSLTTLLDFGIASVDEDSGALMCRRMVRDEEIRQIRAKAGKKGGNPVLLNQSSNQNASKTEAKPKQTVKQNPTPSSSSSSSFSSSIREEEKREVSDTPRTHARKPQPPITDTRAEAIYRKVFPDVVLSIPQAETFELIDSLDESAFEATCRLWQANNHNAHHLGNLIDRYRNDLKKAEAAQPKPKPKLQSVEEVVAEREKHMQIGARPGQ